MTRFTVSLAVCFCLKFHATIPTKPGITPLYPGRSHCAATVDSINTYKAIATQSPTVPHISQAMPAEVIPAKVVINAGVAQNFRRPFLHEKNQLVGPLRSWLAPLQLSFPSTEARSWDDSASHSCQALRCRLAALRSLVVRQ